VYAGRSTNSLFFLNATDGCTDARTDTSTDDAAANNQASDTPTTKRQQRLLRNGE